MANKGYAQRKIGGRKTGGRKVGIVYDGELTEDLYFRGWRQVLGQGKLRIIPSYVKSGGNPRIAVQAAVDLWRNNSDIHEMWCVTDVDNASAADVNQAKIEAKRENIGLCLSNRCFEVWFYCHFGKSGATVSCEADAIALLQKDMPGYGNRDKAVNFAFLLEFTGRALQNAEWLRSQKLNNPMTDVDLVVSKLFTALAKRQKV